jgi:hypothetical protein
MKYFESFPKLLYTFDKNTINVNAVTDILARNTFLRDILDNVNLSYEYIIKDSDTPDVLASKVYGDPYRSWVILLFNNILNPNYDWPLKDFALNKYIESKYGISVQEAKSIVHHYEKETTTTSVFNGVILNETKESSIISEYEVDYATNELTPQVSLPTEADSSLTIESKTATYPDYVLSVVTKNKAVSIYTFEFEENEKKRTIRLLDPVYIDRVEREFRALMNDG